jgi:metallo-beta-lactamase family protein
MGNRIRFFGAARTVTGSRHLLTLEGRNVLVDCGLFQGRRNLREKNWEPFPVEPKSIEAVLLTHAHLDHSGYLPKLVRDGFAGPVYATPATYELCKVSLPDSGRIQEEDARLANKVGSRHHPALPLYTEAQAYDALKRFVKVDYGVRIDLPGGATCVFHPAGHILGSAFAEVFLSSGERILMSGDLGRYHMPVIRDPEPMEFAEYLVMESTYGDRLHPQEDLAARLEEILRRAFESGGSVIVPSFAIGRTQELLFHLYRLQREARMPRMPIFVDSPMATSVTFLYERHREEHDQSMAEALARGEHVLEPDGLIFVRDRQQSKMLNSHRGPIVVIAGSGMATGGRIMHHLKHRLPDENCTVLFTGYQAEGTVGRQILEGAPVVRIHKQEVEVKARVEKLNALSAHADQAELLEWLKGFRTPPRTTFLVHGEPPAQDALASLIENDLEWKVEVPEYGDAFDL